MDALFSLGGVTFGVPEACLQELRRSRAWRWATDEVLLARPRRSFTGPGAESIELEGVVYPGQLGDADAIRRLEDLADAGQPHALADSSGRAYGRWTIERITEDHSSFFAGGTARRIAWTMELGFFPDD